MSESTKCIPVSYSLLPSLPCARTASNQTVFSITCIYCPRHIQHFSYMKKAGKVPACKELKFSRKETEKLDVINK